MRLFSSASTRASIKASPSIDAYRDSAGVVNREPGKISFHPEGQQMGALSIWQSQCF